MLIIENIYEKTRNIQGNILNHPFRHIVMISLMIVFISCGENANNDTSSKNVGNVSIGSQGMEQPPQDPAINLTPGQPHEQIHGNQNIFTIEEPSLQSCLIQVLGEKRYYELRMVQPNPEDMLKIGPCMPLTQESQETISLMMNTL